MHFCYGRDITKAMHCKAKYVNDLTTLLDAEELILLSDLPRPWTIECEMENRTFPLEYLTHWVISRIL